MVKYLKAILRVAALAFAIAATSIIAQAQGRVRGITLPRPSLITMVDTTGPNLPPEHLKTRFYVVNSVNLRMKGDTTGLYGVSSVEADGVIVLALDAILAKGVVTHEQGHLLLDWAGIDVGPYHIAEFFDRCGLKPWGG